MEGNRNLKPVSRVLLGTTFCPLVIMTELSSPKTKFQTNSGKVYPGLQLKH
jgi:hypothetical protein